MTLILLNNIGIHRTYDLVDLKLRIEGVYIDETVNSDEK